MKRKPLTKKQTETLRLWHANKSNAIAKAFSIGEHIFVRVIPATDLPPVARPQCVEVFHSRYGKHFTTVATAKRLWERVMANMGKEGGTKKKFRAGFTRDRRGLPRLYGQESYKVLAGGAVEIGCSTISFAEIKRMAKKLGFEGA